jgi:hypothetical protein
MIGRPRLRTGFAERKLKPDRRFKVMSSSQITAAFPRSSPLLRKMLSEVIPGLQQLYVLDSLARFLLKKSFA